MRIDRSTECDSYRNAVFFNGNVITVEPGLPRAQAFAVKDGRFLWVGKNEDAGSFSRSDFRQVDLEGAAVVPGLTDCHVHLTDFAQSLLLLDVSSASSSAELVQTVAERARRLPPGTWLVGQGWNDTKWKDGKRPSRELLDPVTPSNPVFLSRIDLHTALVNSLALGISGITKDTPDPPGGRIERDVRTQEPTGILVDAARALVRKHIPELPASEKKATLLAALDAYADAGLTAVHDAQTSLELIEFLCGLESYGRPHVGVNLMLDYDAFEKLESMGKAEREGFLRGAGRGIALGRNPTLGRPRGGPAGRPAGGPLPQEVIIAARSVKVFADGALGSRGALLSEPYSDDPGNTGVAMHTKEELVRMVREILRSGYQPAVHAIGDLANQLVLDAYEECGAEGEFLAARPRLEHAQLLSEGDVARCGKLGLTVSVQPAQLISDMPWLEARLGPRRVTRAYVWRSLLDAGARLVSGSDSPIESHNPFLGIYAAAYRQGLDGQPAEGWFGAERISSEEALRTYTLDAAFAAWEDETRGSIRAGKRADFVVLDRDILSATGTDILETRVLATFVEGRRISPRV